MMDLEKKQPKYIAIYKILVDLIHNSPSGSNQYLPSERDLSQQFKVDRLTVRKALDLLAKDGLIQKQAGKSTLIIHPIEKIEKRELSKLIAFVLPRGTNSLDRITEPFNSKLLYLIENELKLQEYHILYATVTEDGSLPLSVSNCNACGIIFVSQVPEKAIQEAVRTKLPTVVVNRLSNDFPMILQDRYQGFHELLEYLFAIGHRKIVFINGEKGYYSADKCEIAFNEFTAFHAHDRIKTMMISGSWDYGSGKKAMKKILLEKTFIPTVVCGCNDMVALGAMEVAKEQGFKLPKEMSFVGFDDTQQCEQSTPRLSTISVNIPLTARFIVEALFSSIALGNPGPIQTIIPTEFVSRESIIAQN